MQESGANQTTEEVLDAALAAWLDACPVEIDEAAKAMILAAVQDAARSLFT